MKRTSFPSWGKTWGSECSGGYSVPERLYSGRVQLKPASLLTSSPTSDYCYQDGAAARIRGRWQVFWHFKINSVAKMWTTCKISPVERLLATKYTQKGLKDSDWKVFVLYGRDDEMAGCQVSANVRYPGKANASYPVSAARPCSEWTKTTSQCSHIDTFHVSCLV